MASVFNRGTRDKPLWYAKFRGRDGVHRMKPTKQPTKARALWWALEYEAGVEAGKVDLDQPKEEMTFAEAASYWLANHSAAACASHDDNVGRMKHLTASFGKMRLSDITAQRIDEFRAAKKRQTKHDPKTKEEVPRWAVGTVNRMLALLRKVLNDCVRWDFLVAAPKVKLLPVSETDFDYLHRDEAERLLSWCREHAPSEFPIYATAI